jgi:hypothetical protein
MEQQALIEKSEYLEAIAPGLALVAFICMTAWVITTWLRVKHGYPLENSWGKSVYPSKVGEETVERIKLLSQENAQLRAELGAVKDRLANVERIVIDESHSLNREIEALRGPTN